LIAFVCPFIHSFNKHVWNTNYEPSTVLEAGDPRKQGKNKNPKELVVKQITIQEYLPM
jgi:hypothetical protein